jgi:hypothetical protein
MIVEIKVLEIPSADNKILDNKMLIDSNLIEAIVPVIDVRTEKYLFTAIYIMGKDKPIQSTMPFEFVEKIFRDSRSEKN